MNAVFRDLGSVIVGSRPCVREGEREGRGGGARERERESTGPLL